MVEKGSDHSSDKSPSTPEQGVQRSCPSQSGRSGGKNSKVSQTPPGTLSLLIGWLQGSWHWGDSEAENPVIQGPDVIGRPLVSQR